MIDKEAAQQAFEAKFPMPSNCVWTGHGYCSTEYNAWAAHDHCQRWQGWLAALEWQAAAPQVEPVQPDMALMEQIDQVLWTVREFAKLHHGERHNITIAAGEALEELRAHCRAAPKASGQPAVQAMSDEAILHRWDTHVGHHTGTHLPLEDADKIAFARSILYDSPPADPLSLKRLCGLLVKHQVVDSSAIDDAEGYDEGVTMGRIEALHRAIAVATIDTSPQRVDSERGNGHDTPCKEARNCPCFDLQGVRISPCFVAVGAMDVAVHHNSGVQPTACIHGYEHHDWRDEAPGFVCKRCGVAVQPTGGPKE